MAKPRYAAARVAAPLIHRHFVRHAAGAAEGSAHAADVDRVEALIDAAFWASLRREENYVPRISLALVPPDGAAQPLFFDAPLPLTPATLVRVAPAVDRPGNHLAVWPSGGELRVWGTARDVPPFTFVLEAEAPGLLVAKHYRGDRVKYVNIAVLEGELVKIIDERASILPDCPGLLTPLAGLNTPRSQQVLVQLAVSMRAHRRGGLLLVIPSETEHWRESMIHPLGYPVAPPFAGLAESVGRSPAGAKTPDDSLAASIACVAGLTAVDGAVVLTDRYHVLAFGAKIGRRERFPLVEQVAVTEPIEGGEQVVVHATSLGGTRHLSAAQFVHDQRHALALVASQDGRFTVLAWSPSETMVRAHRIEVLLL
jgi:hypothetical protein